MWAGGETEAVAALTTFAYCEQPTQQLELLNVGGTAIDLAEPEQVSGVPVSFGSSFTDDAFFRVEFAARRIEPNGRVVVNVTWNAWKPVDFDEKQAEVRVRATTGESVTLLLQARRLIGSIDLPGTIDFGSVMVGDTGYGGWMFVNPTEQPLTYGVGAPQSMSEPNPFSFALGSASGEVVLPPDSSRNVELEFRPQEVGSFVAVQRVSVPPCNDEYTVRLKGRASLSC